MIIVPLAGLLTPPWHCCSVDRARAGRRLVSEPDDGLLEHSRLAGAHSQGGEEAPRTS